MTTPDVPGFEWREGPAGPVLVCSALLPWADHAFTSRALNFRDGQASDDYARLARVFTFEAGSIVRVRQVHGRVVQVIRPGAAIPQAPEADALVSTDPGRALSVRIADCVPILMADRHRRVVAAVHAGWRGTAAGISGAAVAACEALGASSADLVAAIGPSIGPCCYQVDDRVRDRFAAEHRAAERWFAPDGPGRWRLDLWRANVDQLIEAGVPQPAVHVAALCTADHPEVCFSYRREGERTGRMVAAIRVRT
jgi:YfiH family protein